MTRFLSTLTWFALFCALPACGDDDGPARHEASCDRACVRAQECSSAIDAGVCATDCKDDTSAIGPNLRSDFLEALDDCVGELTCLELAGNAVFQTCQREAAALTAPSAAAEALCDAVVESIRECTGLTVGTAGCLDGVKVFHDAALLRARACEDKSCDQRTGCLRDELGIDPAGM